MDDTPAVSQRVCTVNTGDVKRFGQRERAAPVIVVVVMALFGDEMPTGGYVRPISRHVNAGTVYVLVDIFLYTAGARSENRSDIPPLHRLSAKRGQAKLKIIVGRLPIQ